MDVNFSHISNTHTRTGFDVMAFHARVLFIDAYDSFSNNIIALVQTHFQIQTIKIYIDAEIPDFISFLAPFAAVICGPGPGHPENSREVGLFRKVWELDGANTIPVLGICLGFQSLVFEYGGAVESLPQPRHGVETFLTSSSTSIITGLPEVCAVQYHSLHAILGHLENGEDDKDLWKPSKTCPNLMPLAWDFSKGFQNDPDFQQNPKKILMAVKHIDKPCYGVQFHPESICSKGTARQVVSNWWQAAMHWLQQHSPDKFTKLQSAALILSLDMSSDSNSIKDSSNWKSSYPICASVLVSQGVIACN
jgi:para-aminobenzoate synthetase